MMYLHEDRELFRDAIFSAATELGKPVPIVEKDYYVTMVLKLLAARAPKCVFKGGTSLSKAYHMIDRFSEDIDITSAEPLSQGMRKKLKNDVIQSISDDLNLPISNWDKAQSRRDFNRYIFGYSPLDATVTDIVPPGVQMEVVLSSLAFPTVQLDVDSLVYRFLSRDNMDVVDEYDLHPFPMTVQTIERTFADKVFALCDYYLTGKIQRKSRHIYDLYMLLPKVLLDEEFRRLVVKVREQRAGMSNICPSAVPGFDVPALLMKIIDEEVYRKDYTDITSYFQDNPLEYDTAIKALKEITGSGLYAE